MAGRTESIESEPSSAVAADHPSGRYRVRPAVKAAVTTDDQVLLVKERHASGDPFWTLPGGGLEDAETPRAAIEREVREELGAELAVSELLGVCPYFHRTRTNVVSMYLVFGGDLLTAPTPNSEEGIEDVTETDLSGAPARLLPTFRARLPAFLDRSRKMNPEEDADSGADTTPPRSVPGE